MTQAVACACKAVIVEDRIWLTTPFRLKDVVKGLPGAKWNPKSRQWTVPATASAASAVVEALSPEGLDAEEAITDMASSLEAVQEIKQTSEGELELPPLVKTAPWHHQVQGYWFLAHVFGDLLEHGR